MPFRLNRFVVISVLFNLGLCASITLVAMIWCIMNIRRQYQGPLLMQLSHTHGVHQFDAMVAVVEFGLILLLTLSLVYTASRGQRQPDS